MESVTYAYPESREPVINQLDLHIPPGCVTALLGPSGCGKSTSLYLCGMMLTPLRGRVIIGDCDTTQLSDRMRSRMRGDRIGFVFQDAMLDPRRSVMGNILEGAFYARLSPKDAETQARDLLDQLDLGEKADAAVRRLSGGQAQRVALCRALIKRPDVILADEPTGNLDQASGLLVMERLLQQAHEEGAAVLTVTHDEQIAARSDRAILWEELHAPHSSHP